MFVFYEQVDGIFLHMNVSNALSSINYQALYFLIPLHNPSFARQEDEKLEFETTKDVKVVNSFDAMGLKEQLLRGIYQYGFEKPSAIQQRAILPIISGRDVIAQAQSGTGKTSLIALTLCQIIDTQSPEYVQDKYAF